MKRTLSILVVAVSAIVISFSFTDNKENQGDQLHVLVKYKALPDKSDEALAELKTLIAEVKKEPHYKSITILNDPEDPTNILLYEQWNDAAYYKGDHLKTAHLQNFMTSSRSFLAGPPDISFWKEQ